MSKTIEDKHAENYIPPEVVEQQLMERPMKGSKRGKTARDKERQSFRNVKKKKKVMRFKNESPDEERLCLMSDNWVDQICELQAKLAGQPPEMALIGKLERVLHFIHLLSKCNAWIDVVSVTSLFCGSMGKPLLSDIFFQAVSERAIFSNEAWPEFETVIKDMSGGWKQFVFGRSFRKITKIVGVATAFICLKNADVVSADSIRAYCSDMCERISSATSFADLLVSVALDFLEIGWKVFVKGDWKSLLYSSSEVDRCNEEWTVLLTRKEEFLCGNMQDCMAGDEIMDAIDALILRYKELLKNTQRVSAERAYLERKYFELEKFKVEILARREAKGLRKSPYSLLLFGDSGVGKSYITSLVIQTLMKVFPLGTLDDVVTLNETDKYESNMRSDVKVVIMDDIANTREQHVTTAITDRVIRYINNVTTPAVMADVNDKGKVSINPRLLVGTTNVRDIDAGKFSNNPSSILRRFTHVSVSVKPEFRRHKEDDIMLDTSKLGNETIPDAWELTVHRARVTNNPSHRWEVVRHKGRDLRNISIHDLLQYVIDSYAEHMGQQEAFMQRMKSLSATIPVCGVCKQYGDGNCVCPKFSNETEPEWIRISNVKPTFDQAYRWISFLLCMWTFRETRTQFLIRFIPYMLSVYCITCVVLPFQYILPIMLWAGYYFSLKISRNIVEQLVFTTDGWVKLRKQFWNVAQAGLVAGGCYLAFRAFQVWVRSFENQGCLLADTEEKIQVRGAETNPWVKVNTSPVPVSGKARTTTTDALSRIVEKNLVSVETPSGKHWDMLFLKTNIALSVSHTFDAAPSSLGVPKTEFLVKCTRYRDQEGRGQFKMLIGVHNSVRVGGPNGRDLRIYYVTGGPSFGDITQYLPEGIGYARMGYFLRRLEQGDMVKYPVAPVAHDTQHFTYRLPTPTSVGFCGAVIITDTKFPCIYGMHHQGSSGERVGKAVILDRYEIERAITHLRSLPGLLVSADMGDFPTERFGGRVLSSETLHEKSPLNFLNESPSNICIYGTTAARAKAKSRVVTSLLSPYVAEVMGVPNRWGPPKLRGPTGHETWFPWREDILSMTAPMSDIPWMELKRATEDYTCSLLAIIVRFHTRTSPLNDVEVVNGRENAKYIRRMNLSSSPGFPFGGAKRDLFEPVENTTNFAFPTHLLAEVSRCEEELANGRRCYFLFKSSLKDEVTASSKDKVRVFSGADLVCQFLVRKYFLPIVNIMSIHPLDSECAVGVVSNGPEWTQLMSRVDGREHVIAGDYKAYDKKMSSQLINAAFWVLIEWARHMQYTERDLRIMESIAHEVSRPIYLHNGDVFEMNGSNPSGHNLTVYVNCVVNSILHRCVMFREHPEVTNYKDNAQLTTYGDDFKAGVGANVPRYNNFAMKRFLNAYGMEYTMPDKKSVITEWNDTGRVEFLKRFSVRIPELDYTEQRHHVEVVVGALSEDSILKSLHAHLSSPHESMREHAVSSILAANREWFNHGRAVFERRNRELRRIAEAAGIDHATSDLLISFDEHCAMWRATFLDAASGESESPTDDSSCETSRSDDSGYHDANVQMASEALSS